jgi:hypothetical protein
LVDPTDSSKPEAHWLHGVDGCGVTVATMDGNEQFYSLALLTNSGREMRFTSRQTTKVAAALLSRAVQKLRFTAT